MYPVIDMKATGIRLRRIMEQEKITAKCIQQYLGLSCVQSIYRWISGRSMPTIDHLYAFSFDIDANTETLKCTVTEKISRHYCE